MSLLYNLDLNPDGSYSFFTDSGQDYLISFYEYTLIDTDRNEHRVYNIVFSRDRELENISYEKKYDAKISCTIISVINNYFKDHDSRALLYFCYSEDGFARHRNITFKKWSAGLRDDIEAHDNSIVYSDGHKLYAGLIISKDNPLKSLILEAFKADMEDTKDRTDEFD